ncbi:Protein SAV [Gracilariopsis chorda]|uniref:Protein SAV n=1 Tax=Gracilariopsis chorda TaxID=448386 RepID=A0A2V3IVL4_9FLOR|nr:Protein SAV [Gracilariopsis chorda]|eukprot:PXF46186.1 Protein SAV [Gracilariopsis chorda]
MRAFVFIILNCAGVEGPLPCERRSSSRHRSDLYNCRKFAAMTGDQMLHFLSPSRNHFTQGLLEVDEEFAAMYNENKFRAPREVLKAVYGCTLTVDEAMTLGSSAIAQVLSEEPGSIIGADAQFTPATLAKPIPGIADVHLSDTFRNVTNRDRTTDDSSMLDFLSELRIEDEKRLAEREKHAPPSAQHPPSSQSPKPMALENGQKSDGDEEETVVEADVKPFKDDMDYLKDGFDVVQEACKVHNFREKSNEEDRYTSTKRPVEALQREANAKLRKAMNLFTRRLTNTTQAGAFLPRLELLVGKLKLAHFERMVILTLVGAVLSQTIRKTLRSDPSANYDTGITVSKLLRLHCGGELREEIKSRSYFYRNATLIRSGIVTIDVPYNMTYSDLGDFCCELDHMVLDYVAGLSTELDEIMDSARCYSPKIDMDSVILPEKMKQLVLQRVENFEVFRKLRKEIGFDDIVRYGKGLTLFFHGKSGTGKTLFANALASYLNKKLLVVDFASLNNSKHSNEEAYRIVFREAKVHGAIVFMDECDELFESRDRGGKGVTVALREMETFDGIMILATNRPQMLDEAMHRRIALSLMFEPPDAKLRLSIWQKHIPKRLRLDKDVDVRVLALEFELTGGFIKNAVFQALAQAVSRVQERRKAAQKKKADNKPLEALKPEDVVVTMEELRQACRLQARGDLKRAKLERRVLPEHGLDRLVATEEAMKTLRNIVMVEKVRGLIGTRWGFKERQARCNCVLMLGPSGCGKSFAAGCLGYETGRPLQRLAATELHGWRDSASQMGEVFGQAAVAGAVVVVEHAEQLLMEAGNADNHGSAGLELLFHMQSFDGLVVLCCTTAESCSQAGWPVHVPVPERVSRLLSYIVLLRAPQREARLRLWKQLMPSKTPVHAEVEGKLEGVAKKYEFTGAKVAACIRRAAAAAAMRRNRRALVGGASAIEGGDGGEAEESEKVTIEDIRLACEAEVELEREADGSGVWMRGLYV